MFEFIETPCFTKALEHYLDDDDYARLQHHLNERPEAGAVVPGSGGVRKLRWAVAGRRSQVAGRRSQVAGRRSQVAGRGERGGLRIIYYLRSAHGEIWMLTLYGKNVRENIPAHLLRQMREVIDDE